MTSHGLEIGLLILRVVTGLVWCGHGSQKLFGWFGAVRRGTLEDEFVFHGYHPPLLFGYLAGVTEFSGGLLLSVGLLTPVAGGLIAAVAVQAAVAAKLRNGLWIQDDGCEYLVVLATIGVAFALIGGGDLSLDAALSISFAGVAAGVVAAAVALASAFLPRRIGAPTIAAQDSGPTVEH